jgi:hypothetical protein
MLKNSKFAVEKVMKKVGDVSGTVMSLPMRMHYKAKGDSADIIRKRTIQNRAMREMAKSSMEDAGNESDKVFRTRVVEKSKKL